LTHNIDGEPEPQFQLVRYGSSSVAPMQAELTYISIINDFLNMLLAHYCNIRDIVTIGEHLHLLGTYIPHINNWKQKLGFIKSRPSSDVDGDSGQLFCY